jgi:hypothetical protein
VPDHRLDVGLEQFGKLCPREVPFSQPSRVLPVPNQRVSPNFHVMTVGEVDELVGLGEVKGFRAWTEHLPFHRVFRFEHVEIAGQRCRISRFDKSCGTRCGANQDSGTLCRLPERLRGRRGQRQAQGENAAT